MSHEDLRVAALRYAKTIKWEKYKRVGLGCGIIASECSTSANDIPDVIGWRNAESYLIECKASRSDFLRDADKPQRNNGTGMGVYRYYFAPRGLLSESEIPEGWGLLECEGKEVSETKESPRRTLDALAHAEEKRILLSLIRRIKMREFLIVQDDRKLVTDYDGFWH